MALLLSLTVAACGDTDDEAQVTTADAAVTTTVESPSAAEAFFSEVSGSGTQPSPTRSLLDDEEFAELVRSAKASQQIARELSGPAGIYDVTAQEVVDITYQACNKGVDLAMLSLTSQLPAADLRVLPALNRLVTEVAADCGSSRPAVVDGLSSEIFKWLLGNTRAVPQLTLPGVATPAMRTLYKTACAAIKAGIVSGLKRAVEHKGPAYGLSLAVGGMLTTCPTRLHDAFGGELRRLIGP